MRVRAPGLTSNNPPHRADSIPSRGVTAARRTDPGVCAVPWSKLAGLTMLIEGYLVTMSMTGLWLVHFRGQFSLVKSKQPLFSCLPCFAVVVARLHSCAALFARLRLLGCWR